MSSSNAQAITRRLRNHRHELSEFFLLILYSSVWKAFIGLTKMNRKDKGKIHGKLNASWKISSLAVNGQSFLVIDGYLLDFQ